MKKPFFFRFFRNAFFFLPSFFKINGQYVSTDQIETDQRSLQTIRSYVTHWCIANRFLLNVKGDTYVPNINRKDLDGELKTHIYTLNFKRLCIDTYLQELLVRLEDTEHDKTTTRLVDLHIQIMTDVDTRYVNLYINKLIYTLSNIYPEDNVDHEWEDLFERFPYLWLVYIIQMIMRQATPMPE